MSCNNNIYFGSVVNISRYLRVNSIKPLKCNECVYINHGHLIACELGITSEENVDLNITASSEQDINMKTTNISAGDSGDLLLSTGNGNLSGDTTLATGSGTQESGTIFIDSGDSELLSGNLELSSGNTSEMVDPSRSGQINLLSGTSEDRSGNIFLKTGEASESGNMVLSTGTGSDVSGNLLVTTSGGQNSGSDIIIRANTQVTQNTVGDLVLQIIQTPTNPGNIDIFAGNGDNDAGNVYIGAGNNGTTGAQGIVRLNGSIEFVSVTPVQFPQLTTAQITGLPSPTAGEVVYNSTINKLQVYNGTLFQDMN